MPAPQDGQSFDLGDVVLQGGATLRGAHMTYRTWGTLDSDGSNAIVVPTWYSSWHDQNEWMVGAGKALDPERYFIVSPNMIGNGLSTSPSNTPPPYGRGRFPAVTFYDQVEAQHALLTSLGVTSLELVTGSSMGAAQTYQWAVSHPEMVKRAAPIVGASITSEHNQVFLKSLVAALRTDPAFLDGWYTPDRPPTAGMRAFARIYAGWGLSQAFYWQREYLQMGFSSLEDFLVGFWEGYWLDPDRDPNNLLTMLSTWQHGDVGLTPGFDGDTEAALRSIRCPVLAMPCRTDLYFPPEDEQWAAELIPQGEVRTIDSVYGHFAGLGIHEPDNAFIDDSLKALLSR